MDINFAYQDINLLIFFPMQTLIFENAQKWLLQLERYLERNKLEI